MSDDELMMQRAQSEAAVFVHNGARYVPIFRRDPSAYGCAGCAFLRDDGCAVREAPCMSHGVCGGYEPEVQDEPN